MFHDILLVRLLPLWVPSEVLPGFAEQLHEHFAELFILGRARREAFRPIGYRTCDKPHLNITEPTLSGQHSLATFGVDPNPDSNTILEGTIDPLPQNKIDFVDWFAIFPALPIHTNRYLSPIIWI